MDVGPSPLDGKAARARLGPGCVTVVVGRTPYLYHCGSARVVPAVSSELSLWLCVDLKKRCTEMH